MHEILIRRMDDGTDGKAEQYGIGTGGSYYNADNYYLSEDMLTALDEMFNKVAAEYDLGDLPKGKVYHDDFHSYWNFLNTDAVDFYSDKAGPPPKGFKMYFQTREYNKDVEKYQFEAYDGDKDTAVAISVDKLNSPLLNGLSEYERVKLEGAVPLAKRRQVITTEMQFFGHIYKIPW